jgi:hypothetical protein
MTPRNPFASRHIRPGAIPYFFAEGLDAPTLVARLCEHGWRGAVVGPHGSGKSTLLAALGPHLFSAGCRSRPIALHDGQRRLPSCFWSTRSIDTPAIDLAIIDGYEQLVWTERARLWLWSQGRHRGLLVTSHCRTRLPTLLATAVSSETVARVVGHLLKSAREPLVAHLAARLAARDGNLRALLFDLYDDHERERRRQRK